MKRSNFVLKGRPKFNKIIFSLSYLEIVSILILFRTRKATKGTMKRFNRGFVLHPISIHSCFREDGNIEVILPVFFFFF